MRRRSASCRFLCAVVALTFGLTALWRAGATAAVNPKDAALDAPPAGLTPTTTALSQILAAHDKAAGGAAPAATVERWTFTSGGLSGSETLERSGDNYRATIERGPFVERYGRLDGKHWHQDTNGFTSPASGEDDPSFTAVRVLEDAADPKNDVTVVGSTASPVPAYVLRIKKPDERHPEWIYYDKTTGDIVRFEFVSRRRRNVQTYDDFRTTGGARQAWHIHDTNGDAQLDDDWKLVSYRQAPSLPSATFAPPTSAEASNVSTRAPIRSVFIGDDTVIVRVQVGGRGLDFELDATEPESIIDRGVAAELNLPTFGQVTRLSDGSNVGYETILPEADVGPAHLHDFRMLVENFTYRARSDTRVVGLLGYDFLADHVVHVDYVHDLIEIFPTNLFSARKPVDGGIDLPIAFDDGLLLVPMQFGDSFTDRVIVDNAFPYTIAFGPFYSEHASDFHDLGSGARNRDVPFADGNTVGQRLSVWATQSPSLRFAIADFGHHVFLATNVPYDWYATKVDALIGGDYLHFFDLYFDYPHDRFIVKPNQWFYQIFSKQP